MTDPHYVHHYFVVEETGGTPDDIRDEIRAWAATRDDGVLEEHDALGGFHTWSIGETTYSVTVSDLHDDDRWFHARQLADSRLAAAVYRASALVAITGGAAEDDPDPDVQAVWEAAHDLRTLFARPGRVSVEMGMDGTMGLAEAVPGTAVPEVDEAFVQDLRREQSAHQP